MSKGNDFGRISFFAPLPPRALRVNSRTQMTAWRAKLKNEYQEEVWCAAMAIPHGGASRVPGCPACLCSSQPWERAVLRLEWRHAGVAPDQDNALASLKSLIDVLHTRSRRPLAIIRDDAPDCLTIEPVRCVKVAHRRDEGVLVEIQSWSPSAHAHTRRKRPGIR